MKMNKAEAIKLLIQDFHNSLIARDWQDLNERELEMMKIFKIINPKVAKGENDNDY